MSFEQKDNSGALFRNNDKRSENSPEYSGTVRIDGHDMWINAWLRDRPDGSKYFKLSFKKKDGTSARPEAPDVITQVRKHFPEAELDDSVPF